jgi:ribosome-associated heat shock protein Hsp15
VNEPEAVRLDIWLWRARFFRTRTLATDHLKRKGARISRSGQTRRTDKPGVTISVGDIVTFGRGEHIRTVEILDLGERRGPAEEARNLYRLLEIEP